MELNDLHEKQRIDPRSVLILRHRPREPGLRRVLPWLAAEEPRLYNAYQQTQTPKVERAMKKAEYVASFIGHQPGKALFVGLYKRGKWRPLTKTTYWKRPEHTDLRRFTDWNYDGGRPFVLWFDLGLTDIYAQWKGRLVITWPGLERSWWRWANKNRMPVHAILQEDALEAGMPPWDQIDLTWDQLTVLPGGWKSKLQEWRGIYFILDVSDGKGYVGSASGGENLLRRWLDYAKSGHGGNKKLKPRDRANFRFSILQRVSPDMPTAEVVQIEATWMDRLHTRTHGLND